jgi:DNA sulfur modification protein DndB
LFTLSGIYSSTRTLLKGIELPNVDAKVKLASDFWNTVAKHIPDWQLAQERKASTAELRRDYIHAHTLALAALARVGNSLLSGCSRGWKSKLKKLETLDWARKNSQWEGRAMNAGRLSKKTVNVMLSSNLIKKHLGLKLTAEEQQLEKDFKRNSDGKKQGKAA